MAEITRIFGKELPSVDFTGFRTAAWADGVAVTADELQPYAPTLLHALAQAARADDRTGITLLDDDAAGPERHASYRQLYHQARNVGGHLDALGVRPGDPVLLVTPTGFEFIAGFFGVQMVGAIPVPCYPPAVLERTEQALARLQHVVRHSGARLCLTTTRVRPLLGGLALRGGGLSAIEPLEPMIAKTPAHMPAPRPGSSDPAFIQYTSGSTGEPKGVLILHKQALANIHAVGQAIQVNRRDVCVSWLPLYHDMGLIGTLGGMIYWRSPGVLMSPLAFLAAPRRWLEAISRHRGTVSAAPSFAYSLCVARIPPEARQGLDLSSWRVALNGAEAVSPRALADFQAAFGPCGFRAEAMRPVYGLAEATLAVSFSQLQTAPRRISVDRAALAGGRAEAAQGPGAVELISVGRPIPAHEVAIVDDQGRALPARRVGHIVARGPSLMAGYYKDEAATRAALREGVLWTGDLGFIADGELYVTGRVKDLIIVAGKNYHPEDLERAAAAVPGVRTGNVVAFSVAAADAGAAAAAERVVLVCETRVTDRAQREALAVAVAEAVQRASGVPVDEVALAAPGTLPKTSSGKLQRSETRRRFLDGTLGAGKTSRLDLALILARSGAGLAKARISRLLGPGRRGRPR